MDTRTLARTADLRRADVLAMINRAGAGHTGGALSSLDILTCLYYGVLRTGPERVQDPDRDRFILSKGHSVEGYLAILADRGYIEKAELNTFSMPGSRLIGHPTNRVPGIEVCSGALGHGLPIGVGLALAARRTGRLYRTYVLMGDGEQAEGSVWEAAMAGAHYGLSSLCAIIDRNGLQISGTTEAVMGLDPLPAKWRAFGWDVTELDGHDMDALYAYFHAPGPAGKPRCLIARTIKGKGLPCAENQRAWHHRVPSAEEVRQGLRALDVKEVDFFA